MTVGAFAGLVIDESEFSHQIHAEIRPLRRPAEQPLHLDRPARRSRCPVPVLPMVLGLALLIILLKTGATVVRPDGRAHARGGHRRHGPGTGRGEFSFVLGTSAVANGAIDLPDWQLLLGASILTMMATPTLVGLAPAFGEWLARVVRAGALQPSPAPTERSGHVLILGFGVGGRLVARALAEVARATRSWS
ncbi:MAG: hypothetical protein R2712_11110 [Vicinamibacterales bacterium]